MLLPRWPRQGGQPEGLKKYRFLQGQIEISSTWNWRSTHVAPRRPVDERTLAYANWSTVVGECVISAKFPLPLPLPFPCMYRGSRTGQIWTNTMSLKGILSPSLPGKIQSTPKKYLQGFCLHFPFIPPARYNRRWALFHSLISTSTLPRHSDDSDDSLPIFRSYRPSSVSCNKLVYRYKLESNNIFEISLKRFGHENALPYESPHFRSELNLAVISRVSLDLVVASAIWQNTVHSQKRFTGKIFDISLAPERWLHVTIKKRGGGAEL